MAKKSKSSDGQRYWITRGQSSLFFRVYNDLFYDTRFRELKPTTQLVYIMLGLRSKGQREFDCPKSFYQGFISNDAFHYSIKTLQDAGFIEVETYRNGMKTVYRFSDRWKLPA